MLHPYGCSRRCDYSFWCHNSTALISRWKNKQASAITQLKTTATRYKAKNGIPPQPYQRAFVKGRQKGAREERHGGRGTGHGQHGQSDQQPGAAERRDHVGLAAVTPA